MNQIPKKIHYIWVGGTPKPPIVLKCMNSWKRYMPDYEICEWNEQNYDVEKNEYIRKAYEQKMWAFVSDFMRFDILYQHGGIYLDTDVELLKRIPEEILNQQAFTGVEGHGKVNPGLIFACGKGHWLAEEMLSSYGEDRFDKNHLYTVNQRITKILSQYGFVGDNSLQVIKGVSIYPDDFFCGFDQDVKEICITTNTISVHHYAATWVMPSMGRKLKMLIKRVVGVESYRKLLNVKRSLWGIRE